VIEGTTGTVGKQLEGIEERTFFVDLGKWLFWFVEDDSGKKIIADNGNENKKVGGPFAGKVKKKGQMQRRKRRDKFANENFN